MNQKIKVLVADDAPDMASRLANMLSELEQVEVVGPAGNGREALELYLRHRPLIAVLDLQMPGLSGLELLETIRATDRSILIIMLTNESSHEYRRQCLNAGADYYFEKSEDFDQILQIVGNFIQEQE